MNKTIFLLFILLNSCNFSKSQPPPLFNVNTFPGSYREVAIYVDKDDTLGIIKTIKDNGLNVNFKDPKYNISLLKWAIANQKYYSCKTLLDLGANPNQADSTDFVPPITDAAAITETSSYLQLMLKHGGEPNIITKKNKGEVQYTTTSPLCAAASARLESVKLLIDNGADINLGAYGMLPLTVALITQKIDVAEYFIIDKKADIDKVHTVRTDKDTVRIADLLKQNLFPLGSDEYKHKMRVVEYLKTKGIDYGATPIPKYLYKSFPKEYLEKY